MGACGGNAHGPPTRATAAAGNAAAQCWRAAPDVPRDGAHSQETEMKKIPDFAPSAGTPAKHAKQEEKAPAKAKAATAVIAATLLAIPALSAPTSAAAQATGGAPASPPKAAPPTAKTGKSSDADGLAFYVLKFPDSYTLMGVGDGHTIFKGTDNQLFFLDPITEEKKFLPPDFFYKSGDLNGERRTRPLKDRNESPVFILGPDAAGHTVMLTDRNETFILDPATGDKVAV